MQVRTNSGYDLVRAVKRVRMPSAQLSSQISAQEFRAIGVSVPAPPLPRGSECLRLCLMGDDLLEILADAKRLAKRYREATGRPLGVTGEVAEYEAQVPAKPRCAVPLREYQCGRSPLDMSLHPLEPRKEQPIREQELDAASYQWAVPMRRGCGRCPLNSFS
jgi:hypothetical protein